MAGGKETPRQKMIGMMYLVLTALLALNVSKSILDAFINIEENIQLGNITEYDRGFKEYYKTQGKLKTVDSTGKETRSPRAEAVFSAMEKIDKLTAEKVQFIDKIKLLIFQALQEDLDPKAEKPICILEKGQILNFQDTKKPGLSKDVTKRNGIDVVPFVKPIRMHLHNVSKKMLMMSKCCLWGLMSLSNSPTKMLKVSKYGMQCSIFDRGFQH